MTLLFFCNCNNNYNANNIIILIYVSHDVYIMSYMGYTPASYTLMLSRFRDGIDLLADPRNAFVEGTPQWMIDEWVEFAEGIAP